MRPVLVQAALIAVAGAVLGLGMNAVRAGGIGLSRPVLAGAGEDPGATCEAPPVGSPIVDIGVAEAIALRGQGALFVDARPPGSFASGHVEGALHLPARGDAPDAEQVVGRLRNAPSVVVYDEDGSCAQARHLAAWLRDRGLPDVRVMVGGFPEWQDHGNPAQSGACEACGALVENP